MRMLAIGNDLFYTFYVPGAILAHCMVATTAYVFFIPVLYVRKLMFREGK
jgi:hypothetical protein